MSHAVSHENVALPVISLLVPSAGRNSKRLFLPVIRKKPEDVKLKMAKWG